MLDGIFIFGMKLTDFLISFGAALTAFFTLIIAIFTYKSAREINKTILAQIIFEIRKQFDSDEIKETINILKSMENEVRKGGTSKALTATRTFYQGDNKQSKETSDYVNEYYNIFKKLKILIDAKCLTNEVVNRIILTNEKRILFNIVEPLMRDYSEFDSNLFDEYKKIFSDR